VETDHRYDPTALARDIADVVDQAAGSQLPPDHSSIPSNTGPAGDAVVHRGAAVDRALDRWQAGAAAVGRRVFLPTDGGQELLAHELMHVAQNDGRDADLARPVTMGSRTAAAERGTAIHTTPDPQVLRRSPPPRVETPAWPPLRTPPAAYAPQGERRDAEGNLVTRAGSGVWYLASQPRLSFPIAGHYRYELLPPNPNASFTALHTQCERLRDQQLATATRLRGNGKYWFAKVYYFVTVNELQNIDAGRYQYPHMKMQEVIAFNETYMMNLAAWESGRRSQVEPNWLRAFTAAEDQSSWLGASKAIGNVLLPAMEAHIRFDLPRAIAAVYNAHYAGIPGTSIDDFRADFFAMSAVFDRAAAQLAPEIDAVGSDFNPANWGWAGDAAFPFIFNVTGEREHAWEKTQIISRHSGSNAELDRRLRYTMRAMHPNWSDMEVDGTNVRGYDWQHQPGLQRDTQPGPVPMPSPEPPLVPRRLYFQLAKPDGEQQLADAVRRDQDLRPLLELARWLRGVSGAVVELSGHASLEGTEYFNANLAASRGGLVEYFLFRAGADLINNRIVQTPRGTQGSAPTPEWRFVEITVLDRGHGKQTAWGPANGLPREVR
jgi:hypothetical protein